MHGVILIRNPFLSRSRSVTRIIEILNCILSKIKPHWSNVHDFITPQLYSHPLFRIVNRNTAPVYEQIRLLYLANSKCQA